MGIRVIRILEYEYENEQVAAQDMARWTHSAPAGRTDMRMKSCILPFDAIEWKQPQQQRDVVHWPPRPLKPHKYSGADINQGYDLPCCDMRPDDPIHRIDISQAPSADA